MGEDEAGTAQAVRERHAAAEAMAAERSGRLFKTMGDALFIEFPSVVAAVECAVAIQAYFPVSDDRSSGARCALACVSFPASHRRRGHSRPRNRTRTISWRKLKTVLGLQDCRSSGPSSRWRACATRRGKGPKIADRCAERIDGIPSRSIRAGPGAAGWRLRSAADGAESESPEREMAPQGLEKIESAPGNGAPPSRSMRKPAPWRLRSAADAAECELPGNGAAKA